MDINYIHFRLNSDIVLNALVNSYKVNKLHNCIKCELN